VERLKGPGGFFALARLLVVLLVGFFAEGARAASPEEEAAACVDQYDSGGPFTCTVCGVEAGCKSATECYWGALEFEASDSAAAAALANGYQIYCINRGGSLLASSSPIGAQGQILDRALQGASRSPGQLAIGGILEYAALEGGDSTQGIAAPISKNVALSTRETDLELSGSLMFASGEVAQQYGVATRPTLRFFPGADSPAPGTRAVFGGSLPLQLLVMSGDAMNTSVVYHAGVGAIAGVVFEGGWGAGFAMDALYASGVQLPLQLVGRWSTPFQGGALAIQPALSADAISGGSILDTLQQNVLAGYDAGSLLFGLRVFRQGDDAWVFGVGLSYASHAEELAAGTASDYQRTRQGQAAARTPGQTHPAGLPQEALRALLVVDAGGDVTESARTRAAVTDALRARGIEPLLRTDSEQAFTPYAAPGSSGPSAAQIEVVRRNLRGDLVVWIRAQRSDALNARVELLVFGRGLRARRELVVPFDAVSRAAADSVSALLASFDVRGLPDLGLLAEPVPPVAPPPLPPVVAPPPPVAPPPVAPPPSPDASPPPAPPPPSGEPAPTPAPEETAPNRDGCSKDTDCKGERICENGTCVNPPKRPR
jgi:hypothetical protein